MVIELKGVEFKNKGAELMLLSILEKIRISFPDSIIVMERRASSVSIKQQRNVGIFTKLKYKRYGIEIAHLGPFIPKFLRRKFKFILDKEIDVILDGSGFAYGDFWGAEKAKARIGSQIRKWKKDGKSIVLLPQAFGPFSDGQLRSVMTTVINNADIIFARDKYSFGYLKELNPSAENVKQRPDFTNLFSGIVPSSFQEKNFFLIIPNYKMIESGVFEDESEYIAILIKLVDKFHKGGHNVLFLNHEGVKDLQLLEKVNMKMTSPIKIINENNPVHIKGIIGRANGVITSRFHGLVSALSQSVPSLCLGWSHKYQALLEDYEYSDALLLKTDFIEPAFSDKMRSLTDESERVANVKKLNKTAEIQKSLSVSMWEELFAIIEAKDKRKSQ